MVEGSWCECIFIDLFDPEVVQARDESLLFARTARLLLDAREPRQPALVVLRVRGERGLGGRLRVLLNQPVLVLRAAQHLLPVNGSLLSLGQLSLLRNTVLAKLIVHGSLQMVPAYAVIVQLERILVSAEGVAVTLVNYARSH